MIARSLIVGLFLLAYSACPPRAVAGEDKAIPVTINAKNQMSVPIIINGQPSTGIVDTGATFPLVDNSLLPPSGARPRFPDVTVQGLSGAVDYEVTSVSSLEIAGDRMTAVQAGVNDSVRFPGLLNVIPADAFKESVIDFDFRGGFISLYDGRPISDSKLFRSRISYQEINQLPFIPVKINGAHGMALIDTGSNSTFLNTAFADSANVRERNDLVKDLFGVDQDATHARIIELEALRVGRHRINNYNVMVADPELFDVLGFADRPVMIIGLDVLRHFRVQIDRERRHIWLGR